MKALALYGWLLFLLFLWLAAEIAKDRDRLQAEAQKFAQLAGESLDVARETQTQRDEALEMVKRCLAAQGVVVEEAAWK